VKNVKLAVGMRVETIQQGALLSFENDLQSYLYYIDKLLNVKELSLILLKIT
jgi:hypothetical protein